MNVFEKICVCQISERRKRESLRKKERRRSGRQSLSVHDLEMEGVMSRCLYGIASSCR